jgi:mannose-1-phosphate guanylyltransferase/phosphomannomutase
MIHATNAAGGIHVRLSPFDNRVVDIKFFDDQGLDIDNAAERTIENIFFREDYRRVYLDEIGRIDYLNGVEDDYITGFFNAVRPEALQAIARRFNIVVDYANANASTIPSTVLRRLRCDVVELNANLNEARIFQTPQEFNAGMDQLASIVPVLQAELGVRLDPGGEKMFIVDDLGRRLSDLQTLAALTDMSMRCNNGGTVAVPVDAPHSFEKIAARYGGKIVRTRASLAVLMQTASANRDYLLLGDAAGNLIFPAFYPIADGLFAMVKLMELLALQQIKLSTIVNDLPSYYMVRTKVPCRWENKGRVMRMLNERYADREIDQIDGVKIELGEAWVLVLPDQEGPFFHVIAEGTSDEQARALTSEYAELVTALQ